MTRKAAAKAAAKGKKDQDDVRHDPKTNALIDALDAIAEGVKSMLDPTGAHVENINAAMDHLKEELDGEEESGGQVEPQTDPPVGGSSEGDDGKPQTDSPKA